MKYLLIPLSIILAYLVYDSVNSEVEFNANAEIRIAENVEKLKDLRQIQIKYKQSKGNFADNFEDLINFLKYDSVMIISAIGEIPDTLTEEQALKLVDDNGEKIIIRDTSYTSAEYATFDSIYMMERENIPDIYELITVPYSKDPKTNEPVRYKIDAGAIEKGNVTVQVFEISTNYKNVFAGLNAENKGYELDELLKVGSMDEASLNGNWGE